MPRPFWLKVTCSDWKWRSVPHKWNPPVTHLQSPPTRGPNCHRDRIVRPTRQLDITKVIASRCRGSFIPGFHNRKKLSLSLCLCQMSRQGGTTRKWRTVREKAEKSLMSAAQATGYLNYRPLTGKSRRPETFCWHVLPPGATAFNILSRKIMGHLHEVNWKCQQSDIAGAFLSSER